MTNPEHISTILPRVLAGLPGGGMSELKPCPFCGGKVELRRNIGSWGYYSDHLSVGCKPCGFQLAGHDTQYYIAEGPERGTHNRDAEAEADAIAAWNRRVG